jgi:hypothetical protein
MEKVSKLNWEGEILSQETEALATGTVHGVLDTTQVPHTASTNSGKERLDSCIGQSLNKGLGVCTGDVSRHCGRPCYRALTHL